MKGGLGKTLVGVAGQAGGLAGNVISGGLNSGAGDAIGQLGNLAAAIPGPWGAVASAGLGIVGGLTNAAFGTKVNQEELSKAKQGTQLLNNFNSAASSFDTLDTQVPATAEIGKVYSGGWYSGNKARRKQQTLENQRLTALNYAQGNIENNVENLYNTQANTLGVNYAAQGGKLNTNGADFTNGIVQVDNGGTHEQNPNKGVLMGLDAEGTPNLVEEGETIFNDYVYSNRTKVPKEVKERLKLNKNKDITFSDAVKKLSKESEERPNDPISKRGLEDSLTKLAQAQEVIREENQAQQYAYGGGINQFAKGGIKAKINTNGNRRQIQVSTSPSNTKLQAPTAPVYQTPKLAGLADNTGINLNKIKLPQELQNQTPIGDSSSYGLDYLRYAPVLGSAIGLGQSLLSKPDYSNADKIEAAAQRVSNYTPVKSTPLGNYLAYNPFDVNAATNKLSASATSTRRGILDNSGGNRAIAQAGLLAADYNAQGQMGDLFRKALDYNNQRQAQIEDFNRATNQYNNQSNLQAQMANQEAHFKAGHYGLSGITQAASMREAIDANRAAALNANLTGLFDNLGGIGREEYTRNMLESNPFLLYNTDRSGNISYKSRAKGGKIKRYKKGSMI